MKLRKDMRFDCVRFGSRPLQGAVLIPLEKRSETRCCHEGMVDGLGEGRELH